MSSKLYPFQKGNYFLLTFYFIFQYKRILSFNNTKHNILLKKIFIQVIFKVNEA